MLKRTASAKKKITGFEIFANRKECQSQFLPTGTTLELEPSVPPAILRLGKLFVDEVYECSKHSANVDFFRRVQLLELLLPWLGYNTLARKGQTLIMEKFYFVFAGILHRTMKIKYMEFLLYYSLVKKVMPRVVYYTLYYRRQIVANIISDEMSCDSSIHLD